MTFLSHCATLRLRMVFFIFHLYLQVHTSVTHSMLLKLSPINFITRAAFHLLPVGFSQEEVSAGGRMLAARQSSMEYSQAPSRLAL